MKPYLIGIAIVFGSMGCYAADAVPSCRMDDGYNEIVHETLSRAINAFAVFSKPLVFDAVAVNPRSDAAAPSTLRMYVVTDASKDSVIPEGCLMPSSATAPFLDSIGVRGGCVAVAGERSELRCSSRAIQLFAGDSQTSVSADPALLYVLAHELAHLQQRRSGEFSGRVLTLELNQEQPKKVEALQRSCDPASTRREEEADAMALQVMEILLGDWPYRHPMLSERGSMYWAIDQMALAADAWQRVAIESEDTDPSLHESFVPAEFPTPSEVIKARAQHFICDTLTMSSGALSYPAPASSHPPMEQRLRRIADALKPVADRLSSEFEDVDFQPVARLQNDLSPILTFIYRETGLHMESLQREICTIVNGSDPMAGC